MNTTTTVSGDQANEMVVKKKLLVFNGKQFEQFEKLKLTPNTIFRQSKGQTGSPSAHPCRLEP